MLTKKDKLSHCNTVSEVICSPQLRLVCVDLDLIISLISFANRTIEDFTKFLGISIETLLHYCDDTDADVRLNASECLNHIIKSLSEHQLGEYLYS